MTATTMTATAMTATNHDNDVHRVTNDGVTAQPFVVTQACFQLSVATLLVTTDAGRHCCCVFTTDAAVRRHQHTFLEPVEVQPCSPSTRLSRLRTARRYRAVAVGHPPRRRRRVVTGICGI